MGRNSVDERQAVVAALALKYPTFPIETIDRLVAAEMDTYRDAKVHTFVPILVQRAVDTRLHEANVGTTDHPRTSANWAAPIPVH